MIKNKCRAILGIIILLSIIVPARESAASELNTLTPLQSRSLKSKSGNFASDVNISKYEKNIFQNDSETLEVYDVPDGCDVSFRSSDSSILSVKQTSDTTCQYTGVSSGSAKIIVEISKTNFFFFDQKKTIRAKVNVSPRAASVMFHRSTRRIQKGQKVKLAVTIRPSISKEKPIFWSKNRKIATITKKGSVRGRKVGTTYVMASISNGKTAKCKIIVRKKNKKQTNKNLSLPEPTSF